MIDLIPIQWWTGTWFRLVCRSPAHLTFSDRFNSSHRCPYTSAKAHLSAPEPSQLRTVWRPVWNLLAITADSSKSNQHFSIWPERCLQFIWCRPNLRLTAGSSVKSNHFWAPVLTRYASLSICQLQKCHGPEYFRIYSCRNSPVSPFSPFMAQS